GKNRCRHSSEEVTSVDGLAAEAPGPSSEKHRVIQSNCNGKEPKCPSRRPSHETFGPGECCPVRRPHPRSRSAGSQNPGGRPQRPYLYADYTQPPYLYAAGRF